MGLISLWHTLVARKYIIALALLVSGVIALAAGASFPRQYKSTAIVQIDSLQENLLTGSFEPRVRVSEFLGQHAAIAMSRTVALKVIDTLSAEGFLVMADFEEQWREETNGELVAGNDPRLWAADQLLEKLEIDGDALSSTMAISFVSDDSAQASRIANAFANGYMETVLDRRKRRSARNAANFSDETFTLESELEAAQRNLSAFREESGIVGFGERRLEGDEVELASLTLRLAESRADLSEAQSLLRQARSASPSDLLTLPLPNSSTSGRQAQSRLGGILVQLQRLGERYDESYPDYVEALSEKNALEATIRKSVEDRAEFAARRVAALSEAVRLQKVEVLDLQETKQQFEVLSKKVDASRQTYDLVATRSLQESLQSRVDFVDVHLLARAVPSAKAVTPPLLVIVLIGMIAGGAIGAGAAVALEIVEGRIRGTTALTNALGAPVIAEVPAPRAVLRQAA